MHAKTGDGRNGRDGYGGRGGDGGDGGYVLLEITEDAYVLDAIRLSAPGGVGGLGAGAAADGIGGRRGRVEGSVLPATSDP